MGGHGTHVLAHRLRAALALAVLAALGLSLASCGSGSSSDAGEPEGSYRVAVGRASFATDQQLGQTYLLHLRVRNSGQKTVPALTVSFSIKGKEGEGSNLPFGIRDPQPELAQPDRPVWVLAEHYPKAIDSSEPGGAETSDPKTFDFGPLKAGESTDVVWKLSAVRSGSYTLRYGIGAGLGGKAKTKTGGGASAGGSFAVAISAARHDAEVKDNGEVVEIE